MEGVETNAANNTILDAPPAKRPRLNQRVRETTFSSQESEHGLDQAANLRDRHVGTPTNLRTRSVTGRIHDAKEQRGEEERLKSSREAWDLSQGLKIAMMRAAEKDLRILTKERQAKLNDLERIN